MGSCYGMSYQRRLDGGQMTAMMSFGRDRLYHGEFSRILLILTLYIPFILCRAGSLVIISIIITHYVPFKGQADSKEA